MTSKLSTALSTIVLLAFAGCAATPEPAPEPPKPAPRPAAPPPPAAKAEKVTTASTVNFDFDRYAIRPDARSKLDDLVGKQLRAVTLEVIIAVGHADRIGSDAYNMKLSVRRADSVKAYLVSKGIGASRIYTEGKGKRQPVKECKGSGKTKELIACLEPNRRVESEAVGSAQQ